MCYNVYDSQACSVESCDQLEDAIRLVSSNLIREEQLGRFIDAEPNGRWAVYDGLLVKVLWIETDDGATVSFYPQLFHSVGGKQKPDASCNDIGLQLDL